MFHPRSQFLSRLCLALALATIWAFCHSPAFALYIQAQLEEVPIERLAKNLQDELEKKSDDKQAVVKLRLNLARLHAMAYALKSGTAKVRQGKPEEGAWFGYEPKHVPFQVKKTEDAEQQQAAQAQLELAIAAYKKLLEADPGNLTGRLGYAWCLDQADMQMQAITEYRKVIEDGWKQEKDLQSAGLGWHSIVIEAAGYLIPLLDAKADAAEIATLKERSARLQRVPRPITPIAIPLRDGLAIGDILDADASVSFDADGTGIKKRWTWIKPEAAWLVSDVRGEGQIDSAIQLFGNVTWWLFWDNGYQALAALDNDADGELAGSELASLALWHDANGNGLSEPGEVKPLADYGIVALSCRCQTLQGDSDATPYSPQGVRFTDGTVRSTYDVILNPAR